MAQDKVSIRISNEQTAFYAEYKNKGAGSAVEKRVKWSKQLNDQEAAAYTVEKIFKGWLPAKS